MWYLVSNEDETRIIQSKDSPKMVYNGGIWTMCTGGTNTKEELVKQNGILEEPCRLCNQIVWTSFVEPVKRELVENNWCYSCNLWVNRSKHMERNQLVTAGGDFYTLGDEDPKNLFRGFGGAKFQFMVDGALLTSTNVWYGGRVPSHLMNLFPTNAVLIKEG